MASWLRPFTRRPRSDAGPRPAMVPAPPVPEPEAPPSPRRSSQTRQRTRMIAVHVTPDEYAALTAKATEAGLSAGGFLRACGFGAPTPGTQRRTPVDRALMAEAIGALNRTGNNLNQIAKALNSGAGISSDAIKAMQHGYADALNRLMHAAASPPQPGGAANDR